MRRWIFILSVFSSMGAGLVATAVAGEIPNGRTEVVERFEAVIPVAVWGTAEPAQRVTIKSKAGGRIQEIYVQDGQMVRAGSTLVQLDPCDEIRAAERLQAELDRVRALHEQAQIRLCDAIESRPLDVEGAEKTVEEARTHRDELQIDVDRLGEMSSEYKNSTEVQKSAIALHRAATTLARAEVDLQRARNLASISIAAAQQEVVAAEALVRSTQTQLDDARQRLEDTAILAPIDGMIAGIDVRRGELIQSGTLGQGGGSVLMRIVDVARMYVLAPVDSEEIGAVRAAASEFTLPGQVRTDSDKELASALPLGGPGTVSKPQKGLVKITAEAYPNEVFAGVIDRVLAEPRKAAEEKTIDVRIHILGPDVVKLLNLPVYVDFQVDRKKSLLRVANEALVTEGRNVFVYVDSRETPNAVEQRRKVRVRTGSTNGRYTEVLSGLRPGDRVWTQQPALVEQTPPVLVGSAPVASSGDSAGATK